MIKVTDNLFRGPHPASVEEMTKAGIKTCLNLETGLRDFLFSRNVYVEDEELEAAEIQVEHVPFSDWLPPTARKFAECMSVINHAPGPVYIHCMHGVDRTGMVIAYYRVAVQKWATDTALLEMMNQGFHRFPYAWTWLPAFRKILAGVKT